MTSSKFMINEDKLVRISTVIALTMILTLISWLLAWIFDLVWYWWFSLIIYYITLKVIT